uniref:N-acetylgalactosaminide beta-1,3-galactosyltransferase n=1 Tax=Strongyloides venezuelensis TaxID=75913 RepID=A0A0K0FQ06_STRVS
MINIKSFFYTILILCTLLIFLVIVYILRGEENSINQPQYEKLFNNSFDDSVFNEINSEMAKRVKIFCVILTSKVNRERAILQKKTWVKRCDNHIFGSGEESEDIPTFKAYHDDGYSFSFGKMKNTLSHVWRKYGNKYDWYIKADDDTYVIMENLRAFLLNEDPSKHGYHGFRMAVGGKSNPHAYTSGGAGYVMSRRSVKELVEKGFGDSKYCRQTDKAFDDLEVGSCLEKLGAIPSTSLDSRDRVLFNGFDPARAVSPAVDAFKKGFIGMAKFQYNTSMNSVADFPITFHYVRGDMMYAMEYFLYHMEVIGKNSRLNRMEDSDNTDTKFKVSKKLALIEQFSKYNFKKYVN